MRGNFNDIRTAELSQIFPLPEVPRLHSSFEAHGAKIYPSYECRLVPIEDTHRLRSIRQNTRPHFYRPLGAHAVALLACYVLIDGNHIMVRQKRHRLRRHRRKIVSSQQRCVAIEMAHRLMCVRYSSTVMPPLPTSSMSGSFQCPGPAKRPSPAWPRSQSPPSWRICQRCLP